jgi:hypothetical protein
LIEISARRNEPVIVVWRTDKRSVDAAALRGVERWIRDSLPVEGGCAVERAHTVDRRLSAFDADQEGAGQ